MKKEILFEDKDLLVIWKPAGIATQTGKIGQADVVSELKNYLAKQADSTAPKGEPFLGVIHRLDQPVEGLLVFAKNKQAAAALSKQLTAGEEGMLNKQYLAVVCGKPEEMSGELVDYLEKTKDNTARVCKSGDAGAKKAVLQYRILDTAIGRYLPGVTEDFKEAEISLAEITIETGRFHQIRCQMSHAGFPLLADRKYGTEELKALSEQLGLKNVALCAYSIAFKHPTTGKQMSFVKNPEGGIYAHFSF